MARKARVQFPGALHHVIVRGNRREGIFEDNSDKQRYIDNLKGYHERYEFLLYAYVLMTNHVHLLIEEGKTSLSKIMQGINQSYTQYYNKRYGKVGHVFQGRYKSLLCDRDRYLLSLVRYIHLNPVRAGVVKKPEDYRWSSHRAYLTDKVGTFIDKGLVLSIFAKRKRLAVKRYREFIEDGMDTEPEKDFLSGHYIGEDGFIEEVERKFGQSVERRSDIKVEDVVNVVAKVFRIDKDLLVTRSRARQLSRIRGIIGYVVREVSDIALKEIADYFNRDPATISVVVAKIEQEIKTNQSLKNDVQRIIDILR